MLFSITCCLKISATYSWFNHVYLPICTFVIYASKQVNSNSIILLLIRTSHTSIPKNVITSNLLPTNQIKFILHQTQSETRSKRTSHSLYWNCKLCIFWFYGLFHCTKVFKCSRLTLGLNSKEQDIMLISKDLLVLGEYLRLPKSDHSSTPIP